jgi:hypothetical protein
MFYFYQVFSYPCSFSLLIFYLVSTNYLMDFVLRLLPRFVSGLGVVGHACFIRFQDHHVRLDVAAAYFGIYPDDGNGVVGVRSGRAYAELRTVLS